MSKVSHFVRALVRIFKDARDKHDAHEKSRAVLADMAADDRILSEVLERHVSRPQNLNTKNFPSLGFGIASNPHFVLVANSFFPHPQGATDTTFNSVHHHGELLLTTVSSFGPGYEHWLFTTPKEIARERDLFAINVVDRRLHPKGNIAFVDAFTPHAVMYPASLTMTYALWSSRRAVSWKDYVKRVPLIEARAKMLREAAVRLGLGRALDVKQVSYFDYYPVPEGFCGMRERQQFERGPNEDYLESLVSILQTTGNARLLRIIEKAAKGSKLDNAAYARTLIARHDRGETIEPKFSERIHLGIPHMNFKAADILRAAA